MGTARLRLADAVPLLAQLRGYSGRSLGRDLLAGAVCAATLVPQGLGYGTVAGLPPAAGLYTAFAAALVFSLVTSTRFVVVGPSSTLALMTFEAVSGRAAGDPSRAAALAGCLAVLVGLLCVLSPLLRMQRISDLLSGPVMLGYLAGAGIAIFAGQLGVLLGVPAEGERALAKLWSVITGIDTAHVLTAVVGLSAVVLILLLKRYVPHVPASLVVLLIAVLASAVLDLASHGVAVFGAVTGGPPSPQLPAVTAADVRELLPAATGIALIAIAETVTAIRKTADPEAPRLSLGRESTALGAASAASGLLGGFPPTASTSSSLSARSTGARSQLFQVAAAAFVLFALVSGGPMVSVLPRAALAATLIAVTVPRLINVDGFLRLWHTWRTEAVIALVAAVGVVALGALTGLLLAVALAAGQLLRGSTYPHDAVLAVTSPEEPAHEIDEDQLPGSSVLIYRVDAPLFFANAGRVGERIRALAAACGPDLRYLILDAETVYYLDATAAETMADLTVDLRERSCEVLLARARGRVLAALRANPYRQGATRELPAFPGVRQAYAHAQEKLELRRGNGGKDPQRPAD